MPSTPTDQDTDRTPQPRRGDLDWVVVIVAVLGICVAMASVLTT